MKKYNVEIVLLSSLHLGSGHEDVIVDAEVVRDRWGMPYFPGKRLKGLLYESALELAEISCEKWFSVADVKKLFAQKQTVRTAEEECCLEEKKMEEESGIVVGNFYLPDYEDLCKSWRYLNHNYNGIFTPQEVWETYTELRSQTEIDPKTGTTVSGSLHNMRAVDAGTKFYGEIELKDDGETNENIIMKALLNLRHAGTKRNRGFGHIKCRLFDSKEVH